MCVVCAHCEGLGIGKSGDMRTGQIWQKIKRLGNVWIGIPVELQRKGSVLAREREKRGERMEERFNDGM